MRRRSYDDVMSDTISYVKFNNKKYEEETDQEYANRLDMLTEKALEEDAKNQAWAGVYEKTARILTGDSKVAVSMVRGSDWEPAAKSDGKSIEFNLSKISMASDRLKASTHGSFYHELCHLIYTPRENSSWGKWVLENDLLAYANILEDTRIETLYTAKYPSTKLFLLASTFDHVLEHFWRDDYTTKSLNPTVAKYLFALSVGRTYIPADLRELARDVYIAHGFDRDYRPITPEKADLLGDIINEYRLLAFPKDYERSQELILEFKKAFGKVFDQDFGCGKRDLPSKGRPESQKKQEEASQKAKQQPANDKSKGEGTNGDEKSESKASESDSQETAPEKINPESMKGLQEALERFKEFIDSIDSNPAVIKETRDFQSAVRQSAQTKYKISKTGYADSSPMPEYVKIARLFAEELEQLSSETDPTWELEQPSGKLNVTRAMNADINDRDKLFDRWYEGNDSADIEAVILLDNSGSMSGISDRATNALWAIKRGLEKIDASVTAYTFNSVSRLLYTRQEKALATSVRMTGVAGSTNPNKALEETEAIMRTSNKPNKLVFIITDGEWDEDKYSNATIARMQELGVYVSVVFISNALTMPAWMNPGPIISERSTDPQMIAKVKRLRHGADSFKVIATPKEIISVARAIVKSQIKGR